MYPYGYLQRTYNQPPMSEDELDLLFHAMASQPDAARDPRSDPRAPRR